MFLPHDMFRVSRELAAFQATIRSEVARLRETDFTDWPDHSVYSTGWRWFPLRVAEVPTDGTVDLERNRARCPRTVEILARYPEIVTAGISRLLPGCHSYRHRATAAAHVYRCHLGLHVTGPAGLRAGDAVEPSGDGKVCVFDHRCEHEAANLGSEPRDVLLVDFVATPIELRALEQWRLESTAGAGG